VEAALEAGEITLTFTTEVYGYPTLGPVRIIRAVFPSPSCDQTAAGEAFDGGILKAATAFSVSHNLVTRGQDRESLVPLRIRPRGGRKVVQVS